MNDNKIKFTGINLKNNEVYNYDVYTSDFIDQNLYTKANVDTMLANISASLKFDDAPTKDSSNLLSSGTVYSSLSTEASARSTADTTLQTNIDNETTNRTNANDQLKTSITNAQNFINMLQTDIQTESDLRKSSDTTLQTNIDVKANDDSVVHLTETETITGTKTFAAPADVASTELDTTWFNTSNGGRIGIGKDSDNNGSSIFIDQTSGTRRLNLSATSTAGAVSWTQPEANSELIFNISKANFNYDGGSLFISGNNVYPSIDNTGRLGSPVYHFNHSYITSNSIAYLFPLSGDTIDLFGSSNSNAGYIKFGTDEKVFGYNGTELKHGDYTVLTAENSYIKDNAITINKETFNSLELGTTKGTAYDGASGTSLANNLTSEITNRKDVDTTLQTSIDINKTNLTNEIDRATASEVNLQTNIDINSSNLTKETNRAEDSESSLQTNIDKKLDSSPDGTNALIKDNKINTLYIPDAILGQVIYGGSIGANGVCVLSDLFKSKYPTTTSLTITTNSSNTYAGVYFIVSADQTIAAESSSYTAIELAVGDWLLSNGTSGYVKIDNTDSVTGVKGNAETSYRLGNINLTSDNIGTYDKATIDSNISTAADAKANKATSLSGYGITDAYTKVEADASLSSEASTRSSADTTLQTNIDKKQDKLIAGTNINISTDTNTINSTIPVATKTTLGGLKAGYDNSSSNNGVITGVPYVVGTASVGPLYLNPNMTDEMYNQFITDNSAILDTSGTGTKIVTISDTIYITDTYTDKLHQILIYTDSEAYAYVTNDRINVNAAAYSAMGITSNGWYSFNPTTFEFSKLTKYSITAFNGTPTAVSSITNNTLFSNGSEFNVIIVDNSKMPLNIESSTMQAYTQATQATDDFLGCIKTGYTGIKDVNDGTAFKTTDGTTGNVYLNMNLNLCDLLDFAYTYYDYADTNNDINFLNTNTLIIATFGTYNVYLKVIDGYDNDNYFISFAIVSTTDNSGYIVASSTSMGVSKPFTWYKVADLSAISSSSTEQIEITDGDITALSGLTISKSKLYANKIISNGKAFTYSNDTTGKLQLDSSGKAFTDIIDLSNKIKNNKLRISDKIASTKLSCANFRITTIGNGPDTDYSISPCAFTDSESTSGINLHSNYNFLEYIPFIKFENKHPNFNYLFANLNYLIVAPQMDTSNVTDMSGMFYCCVRLCTIPIYDTSNVTTFKQMFSHCYKLVVIPELDVSSVTDFTGFVEGCTKLRRISMYGMKVSFDISASTCFIEQNLVEILENLATVTTAQTLTMGSTNLAKLTDADKLIATNKGWTLA